MAIIVAQTGFVQNAGWSALARVLGQDGAAVTRASLSEIKYGVFDLSTKTPRVALASYTGTLTISSIVYDTLQTDSRWTVDNTGYNFLHAVAAGAFASRDHIYRVEYKLTPVSGQVLRFAFEGPVENMELA